MKSGEEVVEERWPLCGVISSSYFGKYDTCLNCYLRVFLVQEKNAFGTEVGSFFVAERPVA